MYSVSCDYVSTQEFGSIVSNTFDTERTQRLHEFELLLYRINAMFKMNFIFMLFFLVLLVRLYSMQCIPPPPHNITLNFNLRHFNYAAPISFTTTANQIKNLIIVESYSFYRTSCSAFHLFRSCKLYLELRILSGYSANSCFILFCC